MAGFNVGRTDLRNPGGSMFPTNLTNGYRSFLTGRFPREQSRFEALAKGQSPEIMVIGCCDSRVSPEVIFDASPGELFVVRNVANLVLDYELNADYDGTSAAIEFAVNALRVKHIVVLGHADCGGVRAFASTAASPPSNDFVGRWISLLSPAMQRLEAADRASPEFLRRLELAGVENSLDNLLTYPWVRRPVEDGELHLHGAYFGVASGRLLVRDPADGEFRAMDEGAREHRAR
jgi:carbonic anhydrase